MKISFDQIIKGYVSNTLLSVLLISTPLAELNCNKYKINIKSITLQKHQKCK